VGAVSGVRKHLGWNFGFVRAILNLPPTIGLSYNKVPEVAPVAFVTPWARMLRQSWDEKP
jgi:hypothetical protein